MSENTQTTPELIQPHLWDPNVAGIWSVFFSPFLGAFIHAQNWHTLGQSDKAKTNMKWAWATLIWVLGYTAFDCIPPLQNYARFFSPFGLVLLLGWHFAIGRKQTAYIKEKFGNNYIKKSWTKPVCMGLGFLLILSVIDASFTLYQGQKKYETVLARVTAEIPNDPSLKGAKITQITLAPESTMFYEGKVEATRGTQTIQLNLFVTYYDNKFSYKLSPAADK